MTETRLSLETVQAVASGITTSDSGITGAIRALVKAKKQDTELFKELVAIQSRIEALTGKLQPAIFFENDASIGSA